MNILLHMCCGPCAVYPVEDLRAEGYHLTGFFYNPNIHPFREFQKRLFAAREFADNSGLEMIEGGGYDLISFLRKVTFREQARCVLCYRMRLEKLVAYAAEKEFEGFTTTLLYSKYQKHEHIVRICKDLERRYGVPLVYKDFRVGWQQGIDESINMGLYRQPYCGCIYSEQERYDKSLRKKRKKKSKENG